MKKILIIGGGPAGLSAGIYAKLNGYDAVICEKHAIPGGNLTGWRRGGYEIDNCLHWLTGTNKNTDLYKLWCDLGALGDVDIYKSESLCTCEMDGESLSLHRDLRKFEDDLLRLSYGDKKEIKSLIKAVRAMQYICGIGGADHAKKCSRARKLSYGPLLLKYFRLSTEQLSKRFSHPLIRKFIRSFLSPHFMSLTLVAVIANFCADNADLPCGGSAAMAKRMADRFISLGGRILCNMSARQINTSGSAALSVTFENGQTIEADYIIVTTDPFITYGKLLHRALPKKLKKEKKNSGLFRFSSFSAAFAVDADTIPFCGDLILDLSDETKSAAGADYAILRQFCHEKEFAPSGKSIIQAIVFYNEEDSRKFIKESKNVREYRTKKELLCEKLGSDIIKRFPELSGKLHCIDSWTPATYKRYTGSETGSYMAYAFTGGVIPPGFGNRIPGLTNLFLATQWQRSPGGLPVAAELGRDAVYSVMKADKKKKVS